MQTNYFKGRKVTVMGLGLLGRGVGDVKYLAEQGAELIVTDLKSETELKDSVGALKGFSNITFVLGKHRLEDFRDRDFVLKAAGVPLDSPFIAEARRHNIPVEMSSALFASFTEATVIGITGTRGKSTVTHLLYEVLQKAANDPSTSVGTQKSKIFLGGNVKGVSTLAFLREAKKGDYAVLELDSWQLQGFGERRLSPHLSIFTTLFDDHLNYYKNDGRQYLADKANIFKYQSEEDFLVIGKQAELAVKEPYGEEIKSKIVVASEETVPEEWVMKIPGAHNRYNAGLAVAAADIIGVDRKVTQEAVENFKGVPGRLELVREWNDIKIYNDTTATTPDATLVGLRALHKNIVLIFGGADKNLDMSKLLAEIPEHAKAVVLLAGTDSARIQDGFLNLRGIEKTTAATLEEAVTKALEFAKPGDSVLFSPAFASFGLFSNEYDRGEQFNRIVNALK